MDKTESINNIFYHLIKQNCFGCIYGCLSQRDHPCLDPIWTEPFGKQAEYIYGATNGGAEKEISSDKNENNSNADGGHN
jgi:hypothetical protein